MRLISKPGTDEYPAYAKMYIDLLPNDGQLLQHLSDHMHTAKEFVKKIPENKLTWSYAPNKWTIKEILVHIVDDERIYAYRAMCFARNEKAELPGFEQDDYAVYSGANDRDIENIMEEYQAVRHSTIALFNGLPGESLIRCGIANNNRASVRALGYHIAGHELHHINIIKKYYL